MGTKKKESVLNGSMTKKHKRDELMKKYFELITDFAPDQLEAIKADIDSGALHPRDAKMLLGKTIVRMYHGTEAAAQAENQFVAVFQKNAVPDDMPEVERKGDTEVAIVDFLLELNMFNSKSEARRMIDNRGVKLNGDRIENTDSRIRLTEGLVVQVGKRKFVKIKM